MIQIIFYGYIRGSNSPWKRWNKGRMVQDGDISTVLPGYRLIAEGLTGQCIFIEAEHLM